MVYQQRSSHQFSTLILTLIKLFDQYRLQLADSVLDFPFVFFWCFRSEYHPVLCAANPYFLFVKFFRLPLAAFL